MRIKRTWIVAAPLLLIGCGGSSDSALPGGNPGLYGSPVRDTKERERMVADATKELAKGTSAKVAEAGESFGWRILKEVGKNENVLISPLSIATAMNMALNGAQGETQREMRESLGLGKLTSAQINDASRTIGQLLVNADPKVKLRIANSIWAEQQAVFKEPFLKLNQDVYGARVEKLDFADRKSVETINGWVKDATEGKIASILDSIKPEDRMFLINAVYFKGTWADPFNKELTSEAEFTKGDGEKTKVAMMQAKTNVGYLDDKTMKAVALPYGNGRLEMVLMLPKIKDADFRKAMLTTPVPRTLPKDEVMVKIPKFKVEDDYELKDALEALGMKLAFTEKADFSALSQEKLLISSIRHKTYMEVDEQGTEAAAVTSISVGTTAVPTDPKEFVADKPFYLALRERETGIVLFLGYIGNPR